MVASNIGLACLKYFVYNFYLNGSNVLYWLSILTTIVKSLEHLASQITGNLAVFMSVMSVQQQSFTIQHYWCFVMAIIWFLVDTPHKGLVICKARSCDVMFQTPQQNVCFTGMDQYILGDVNTWYRR